MERITGSPLDWRPVGRKAGGGYAGSLVGHRSIDGRAAHEIEGNHPVCLGNIGYWLTQQQPCIGHCRRCALVGKRVVILVGIEVSRLVVEATMVIGRHDGHALASRLAIYDIVIPNHPVVIDLQNHQARRGHVGIPPRLLTILEGEVLILVARYNLVGLFAVGQIFERNGSRRGQLFDGEPAAKFAFIRGVAYGDRTVAMAVAVHVGTVVATIIHQAPGTHSIVGTAGIVEVGQTQRVTVLVAERTDTITIGPGITLQLGRTGVCVEQFAIDRNLFPGTLVDIPGVGPDGVVERTGVIVGRLAVTGIDDINQIDKTVVVAVVDGKIDRRLYLAASVDNHLFGTAVVTRILVVAPVVGHRLVERNGAYHVEGGTELSARLCDEIIACTAYGPLIVVPLFVHHLLEVFEGICRIKFLVAKLDQQHQTMYIVARSGLHGPAGNRAQLLLPLQLTLGNHPLRHLPGDQLLEIDLVRSRTQVSIAGYHLPGHHRTVGGQFGIPIKAIGTPNDRNAIGCHLIMIKLIADHSNGNYRPVGLGYGLRNRPCR